VIQLFFRIANGMAEEVRAAFRQRPHLVDRAPGFLGMEVMSPVGDAAEIWLVTRWCDEQSYHSWHRSHEYHVSHKGIPKVSPHIGTEGPGRRQGI
jgi:heme-degrading monooxygenase HmoA